MRKRLKRSARFPARKFDAASRPLAPTGEVFFCGDPHGVFDHIVAAARAYKPAAMVLLGDMQPSAPIDEILAEITAFTDIWWIPGNHDTDSDYIYDRLFRSGLSDRNLNGRVQSIAGIKIAGLGGVFRGQIWMPPGLPNYQSGPDFVRRMGRANLWRGGLPRRHRSSIFPSTYANLCRMRADVLVTHEAPACHPNGFLAIDSLAQSMGVSYLFHGHQHEDCHYPPYFGYTVRSVGYRGIVTLAGEDVVAAQIDPRLSPLYEPPEGQAIPSVFKRLG